MGTVRYTARQAIEKALEKSVRYENAGFCRRCDELHTEVRHLRSVNLIAEEIYLWLGYSGSKQNLRLFGRIVKSLEDAAVVGQRERDVPRLAERILLETRGVR